MTDFTILELDSVDSTNNYAMQLIDANKACNGLTITAKTQTAGKGQRGRNWSDVPGHSLLMSIIVTPQRPIDEQFAFNCGIATSIAKVLQKLTFPAPVHIKWPNDIIIGDKKAGGILIENVLRGAVWTHSVVGIGINVMQDNFPADLPFATSLAIETGAQHNTATLAQNIAEGILSSLWPAQPIKRIMAEYNTLLYKKGRKQQFADHSGAWMATILGAEQDGTLQVQKETGLVTNFYHGQAEWIWG